MVQPLNACAAQPAQRSEHPGARPFKYDRLWPHRAPVFQAAVVSISRSSLIGSAIGQSRDQRERSERFSADLLQAPARFSYLIQSRRGKWQFFRG